MLGSGSWANFQADRPCKSNDTYQYKCGGVKAYKKGRGLASGCCSSLKIPELNVNFIRGNENVTHSAQGEAAFLGGIWHPNRRSEKVNFHFANYRLSFRKLQIFISQTTDSHFANYRFSFRKLQILISQTTDFHFANYRFSFRKLQILISQTTDTHFANYRFSFRKLQILISQTTDFHFANYRFSFRKLQIFISQTTDFHFVSFHFVSQTTVSRNKAEERIVLSKIYFPFQTEMLQG